MSLSIASTSTPVSTWESGSTADSFTHLSGACALLAVILQTQASTQAGAKTDVDLAADKLEELKQQLAAAVQEAKEAAEHSGFLGFIGDVLGSDVAKVAGAVAAIAATIASGGAGAPLLLVAIAAALQVSAKVGAELGLDPKLCTALTIAAVAVGFVGGGGGASTNDLVVAMRTVETGAKISQGGAVASGAVLHYASARYHADDLDHQADAVSIRTKQTTAQLDMDDAIALLDRALRGEQRETSTVSEIVQSDSDAKAALAQRI
jgi:hypothetical protein